ncbi:RsiV family protein [Acinetobacter sp. BIGb0102]|uniref:RsiV family protein n=1 Tax=Acinetobacter sp. BIGb0102 TaxID=2485131 RepID=UPI000F513825
MKIYSKYIKDYCVNDLIAQISYRAESDDINEEWIKDGCEAIDSTNILIKENRLEIYFAPYSVTAYAFGDFIVDIPFYRLTKFFNKEKDNLFSLIQIDES